MKREEDIANVYIIILNDRFNEPEPDSVREIIWGLFWTLEDYRSRLDSIHNEIIFEAILDLFVTSYVNMGI